MYVNAWPYMVHCSSSCRIWKFFWTTNHCGTLLQMSYWHTVPSWLTVPSCHHQLISYKITYYRSLTTQNKVLQYFYNHSVYATLFSYKLSAFPVFSNLFLQGPQQRAWYLLYIYAMPHQNTLILLFKVHNCRKIQIKIKFIQISAVGLFATCPSPMT
jgi:hypothetical protein